MTECPLSADELQALAAEPPGVAQELAARVLYARQRRVRENRYAGVSWGARRPEESAATYLDRMAERALKREARAARKGGHTNAKQRRNSLRCLAKGKTGADYAETMTTILLTPLLDGQRAEIASLPPQDDESEAHYFWRLKAHARKQGRVHAGVAKSEQTP